MSETIIIVILMVCLLLHLYSKHIATKAVEEAYKKGFTDGIKYQAVQDNIKYSQVMSDLQFLKEMKVRL
jgi:hypothetical protein